jgi:hypothetical protein
LPHLLNYPEVHFVLFENIVYSLFLSFLVLFLSVAVVFSLALLHGAGALFGYNLHSPILPQMSHL